MSDNNYAVVRATTGYPERWGLTREAAITLHAELDDNGSHAIARGIAGIARLELQPGQRLVGEAG